MNRCRRVGVDVTRRCNARCQSCFYRFREDFGEHWDKPLSSAVEEALRARERGCDHVVMVGMGEPGLYPAVNDYIREIGNIGMTSSIITNGTLPIARYEAMRAAGLNHLHISVHGIGEVLDNILEMPGAGAKQLSLLDWLSAEKWKFRTNTTMQKMNFEQLPIIPEFLIERGASHFVYLGFLPHYHWNDPEKLRTVAVHPGDLRPKIEEGSWKVLGAGRYLTIRYHPMCHLDEGLWPYVTNARYVLYDPGEWEYDHAGEPDEQLWQSAVALGEAVAVQGEPCRSCSLRMHCGGWNTYYANGFNGAGLSGISEYDVPIDSINKPGYYFDKNPFNQEFKGWISE